MSVEDDRGQLAGGEAIPFGILVFVVGALLIVNAWAVVDAKFAVDAAAQAAVRDFTESVADTSDDALADAERAGRAAFAASGRDAERVTIAVVEPLPERLERCQLVTFVASHTVPAISLPFIGGYGDGFTVTASHTRVVDPLRSGVAGEATCL